MEPDAPNEPTGAAGWGHRGVEALHTLFDGGHYAQVVAQGPRVLERTPQDEMTHYLMALAYLIMNREALARPHVECLLVQRPNWAPSHHAASLYMQAVRRPAEAQRHIQTAIALEPNVADYHSLAAVLASQRHDLPHARVSVARARELDPHNPHIIRLAVEIQGLSQTTASEAWERIRELEAALALDPNNAGLHTSIGSILLDELDRPREAEKSFRTALLNDPSDRDLQQGLFRAVGHQRMVYRVLSIPQRAFRYWGNLFRALSVQPWRIIFLLVGFKFVLAFVFWLLLVTIVFWPSCKVYEWLLLSEIQCVADASNRRLRWKRLLNRWPFWARFGACAGLILGSWFALFGLMGIVGPGFRMLGAFAGVHFAFTWALLLLRKVRSSHGRRVADRKKKSLPPPLPPHLPPARKG